MGVMQCDRTGCENILCDRHSPKFGYLCDRCFEELCTKTTIDIRNFMESGPTEEDSFEATKAYYETVFTKR
jgi:hypothetical protein